jgi:hypothetical protein
VVLGEQPWSLVVRVLLRLLLASGRPVAGAW